MHPASIGCWIPPIGSSQGRAGRRTDGAIDLDLAKQVLALQQSQGPRDTAPGVHDGFFEEFPSPDVL